MNALAGEYRTREYLCEIFSAMRGKPAYVTNYSRSNAVAALTDDELADQLILALECGAKLIDIFGDMFCHTSTEITEDEQAVKKQKQLAELIHKKGGEVLISTHVYKYLPPEEVLRIARLQAARGADVAKIVTNADTEDELRSNFDILFFVKKKKFYAIRSFCVMVKNHIFIGVLFDDYVFINRCGRPYKTNNVDKKFRYIRKCISEIYPDDDFTDITPHYLRHTFATVGVNAGVPLKSMQALLGHSDTKTLLDTYMHICYEDKRSSIKMIENNTSVKSLPAVDDTLSEKELNNKWSNVKRFKGTENYRNELLHRWE